MQSIFLWNLPSHDANCFVHIWIKCDLYCTNRPLTKEGHGLKIINDCMIILYGKEGPLWFLLLVQLESRSTVAIRKVGNLVLSNRQLIVFVTATTVNYPKLLFKEGCMMFYTWNVSGLSWRLLQSRSFWEKKIIKKNRKEDINLFFTNYYWWLFRSTTGVLFLGKNPFYKFTSVLHH